MFSNFVYTFRYNAFNVYRRELAPSTVNLTGDRAQGDDSKHDLHENKDAKAHFAFFFKFSFNHSYITHTDIFRQTFLSNYLI